MFLLSWIGVKFVYDRIRNLHWKMSLSTFGLLQSFAQAKWGWNNEKKLLEVKWQKKMLQKSVPVKFNILKGTSNALY